VDEHAGEAQRDGHRVLWLTKTLDMILDKDEIGNYAKNCFGKMKDVENKALFTKALYQSEKLSKYNKLIIQLDSENWTLKDKTNISGNLFVDQ
jgi:hypothetical protein